MSDADTKADLARGDHKDTPPLSSSSQIGYFIKWRHAKRHAALLHEAGYLLLGLVSLATVTGLYFWLNAPLTAAAFTYLVVLVLLSLVSNFFSLIVLSFIGVCCLSYFFAPPIYSFRVNYSQDLITISAFVIASFVVNFLVTRVQAEQRERNRTEERLRRSEAYLAEAQRLGHSGVAAYNETTILYGSEEIFRIWGFDPALGVPSREAVFQRVHPDDRDRHRATVRRALDEKRGYSIAYRIVMPDGAVKHLESIGQPVFSASGELVEVVATQIDVTERKRAEQALRERESKIRRLVDANIIGIFIWDLDGRILEANEAFLHTVGYDHEDLAAGRIRWTHLTPPEWRDRDTRLIQEQKVTGTLRPFEKEYFRKDGSRVPVLIGVATFEEGGSQGVAFVLDLTERKCAEDALQRSQFYLNEGQRIAHIGSWGFNPSGFFDHWSQELFQIYGLDPKEGNPTLERYLAVVHPLDRNFMADTIRRMIAERSGCDVKKRIVRPDGGLRYVRCVGIPVVEEEALKGFLGTAMDITDQELLTNELRDSEGKFRDYAETASDWFWEIGPDYKFTLLTENAFGGSASHRLGITCWDNALDFETESEKWRILRASLDSRKPFRDFVYCAAGASGPMYVRASGKPVFDAKGDFRGYRGTGTDVTEIMRAQQALRESERSARSALDGIAGLVAVMRPNGELETVNRQCLEYFGRSLEEQKNWEMTDMVHPEDLPRMHELFTKAIASEIPYHFEQRLRRFDGEYRWFDTRGGAVRDGAGRIARWYVLLTDIEDRKRALAQLDKMQSDFAHVNRVSMMGELAASLSHEITQPIASARNNARAAQNFLDMQPPDLSEVREALGCVVGDTDRAGDMINRIRDQMKKAPPRKAQFDLNEAINEVIVLGQSEIIKNRVWVQTRLSERLFPVYGDRVQLQQVVLNLLLNAVEAMGSVEAKPRDLLISTEQDHRGVVVAVSDSGPGLDPSHLERVFDAFYTTKSSGMGMGLSISRSIIDAHGGQLWAEANAPRGTIFQFTLPATP